MDGTLLAFMIGILAVGVLLIVVITLTKRGPVGLDVEKYRSRWLQIESSLKRDEQASYHLAILNADKLLDQALRDRGIKGETMGERMKTARTTWSNANAVWSAHKLRNQIAHETDVHISYDDARRALAAFKQALRDVGSGVMTDDVLATYEMTIGIECHVQLATDTKLFGFADNDARDKTPNSVVSTIDYGLPGMLPILNRKAVDLAIKAGKALHAAIAQVSRFDRKHYFYPDLPKGYQTTQMYQPIILAGYVDVPFEDGRSIKVRIHHAHMEEDAGKLTHFGDYSLVDLNRAGTPLIEIVSEPDIHSPAAAKAFATELHRLMVYAGVTNGDLYHGNMRFDVNVSVAPKGSSKLGKRAEVKNLNSFRSVEKAAEYEFRRQVALLESGEAVKQETRGWDDAKLRTTSQRSKEDAEDYRYMPDADIPPIVLTDEEVAEIQATVPMLPSQYRKLWLPLELDRSVVDTLLGTQEHARVVTAIQDKAGDNTARRVAHWLASALGGVEEDGRLRIRTQLSPDGLIELSDMVEENELSSTAAKEVFLEILTGGESPRDIAKSKNLLQVSGMSVIAAVVDEVLSNPASQKSVEDIKAGKEKAIGYLVGQVMKKSHGKANPALAQKMIRSGFNMQPWKRVEPTVKTKVDYHEVTVKTFQLPDGTLATRATLYSEGVRAAGVIAVTKDKKVIVGHQFRPGPEKVMIELPGGYVEPGEDPERAAVRELLEETGYQPHHMTFLGAFPKDASVNGAWYYYLATDCTVASDQTLDHDEFIDLELMSIEDFIMNAKKGNMTDPFAVLAAYDELTKLTKEKV